MLLFLPPLFTLQACLNGPSSRKPSLPCWTCVSPTLHPGCVSEKRNGGLFFLSFSQCPKDRKWFVGLTDAFCTGEETEATGPKSTPKVNRLASGRSGTAPHSRLSPTPGFVCAPPLSCIPGDPPASFSRTEGLEVVQGRITHQSSSRPSPRGVCFQACIWAPAEQRKHCARASFSPALLHLKTDPGAARGPPHDLQSWSHALGTQRGAQGGFTLCTAPGGPALCICQQLACHLEENPRVALTVAPHFTSPHLPPLRPPSRQPPRPCFRSEDTSAVPSA